jgi:hypothetical protein
MGWGTVRHKPHVLANIQQECEVTLANMIQMTASSATAPLSTPVSSKSVFSISYFHNQSYAYPAVDGNTFKWSSSLPKRFQTHV